VRVRTVDQAKYDEKRWAILEAARGCFRRDGFRGASISDICAAAKISPGHLYHYFESKEAIVQAIAETGFEASASAFDELAKSENIVDALAAAIGQRLKRGNVDEAAFSIEMLAEGARNPAVAVIVRRRDGARRDMLSRLLREGQRRQQVDPHLDADIAAALLSNAIETFGHLAIRDPDFDRKNGAEALKVLIARFLDPQRVTPPARAATPSKGVISTRRPQSAKR
jgi:TetR/AcrR family transcriptional repressor of uid operon